MDQVVEALWWVAGASMLLLFVGGYPLAFIWLHRRNARIWLGPLRRVVDVIPGEVARVRGEVVTAEQHTTLDGRHAAALVWRWVVKSPGGLVWEERLGDELAVRTSTGAARLAAGDGSYFFPHGENVVLDQPVVVSEPPDVPEHWRALLESRDIELEPGSGYRLSESYLRQGDTLDLCGRVEQLSPELHGAAYRDTARPQVSLVRDRYPVGVRPPGDERLPRQQRRLRRLAVASAFAWAPAIALCYGLLTLGKLLGWS